MNTLDLLLNTRTPMHRWAYCVNVLAMVGFSIGLGYFVYELFSPDHHLFTLTIFFQIVVAVFTISALILLTIRRLHDARLPGLWSICMIVPGINVLMFAYLCLYKGHSN